MQNEMTDKNDALLAPADGLGRAVSDYRNARTTMRALSDVAFDAVERPRALAAQAPASQPGADAYLRAVDEGRVAAHIGTAEPSDDATTATRKLAELIDWHIAVATDPAVNGGFKLVPASQPDGEALCDVASRIGVKAGAVIKFLFLSGIYATATQKLDYNTAALLEQHFKEVQPEGREVVAWLRMRPDGSPDWAEDCIGSNDAFLDHDLEADGYYLRPLAFADTAPPVAAGDELARAKARIRELEDTIEELHDEIRCAGERDE